MNGDRAANGLGPLCGNGQLAGFAQDWANWMAQNGSLTHQYLSPMFGLGLNTLGENILNGAYRAAGVGIAYSPDGRVWVAVDFGG